jgi:quinol monooxygenase YgiN
VIVVTEHRADDSFLDLGRALLVALAGAEGYVSGQIARSPDEPDVWLMVTTWRDVGSMRRGFGSFDAKVAAAPVMLSAVDRVSAFEVMLESTEGGVQVWTSDRSQS